MFNLQVWSSKTIIMKKTTYKHECNKTLNYNKYESTKQIAMENEYKKMHHIKRKYLFYGKKSGTSL